MTRKRLLVGLALVLLMGAGTAYKLVSPKAAESRKIVGTLYTLSDPFLVNLAGGHFGKLSVAVLLAKPPPAAPDGTVTLPQLAAVRAIVTDVLTDRDPANLIEAGPRRELLRILLRTLQRQTDEPITAVYLTDITVQ